MKRLFVFVFLFFICISSYNADDYVKDKLTVDTFDIKVSALGNKKFLVEEKYNTKLIFGDLPDTFYFTRNINLKGTMYFGDKSIDYTVVIDDYTVNSEKDYYVDFIDKGIIFKIGDVYSLLNESESFGINYSYTYNAKKLENSDGLYFILAENDYDINKVNFNMLFPIKIDKSVISFSLDGKKFSKTLDGLTYEVSNDYSIIGTYDKPIKAGDKLVIRADNFYKIDESKDNSKDIIVYTSIGIATISILGIVISIMRRKRK